MKWTSEEELSTEEETSTNELLVIHKSRVHREREDELLPNILIVGTPGSGKTSLGKLLKEGIPYYGIKGYKYINLSEKIVKKKLYKDWDDVYDEPIIDKEILFNALDPEMMERGGIILDFWTA